jgi:hypothetical protein
MFRRMDEPEGVARSSSFGTIPESKAFLQPPTPQNTLRYAVILLFAHMNTVLTGVLTYSIFILR